MDTNNKKVLITGAAGFIGSHLCERFLAENWLVVGVDNFDDFYDPRIKRRNIDSCLKNKNFQLIEADIRDRAAMDAAISNGVEIIVHLAARAGVRPSIAQPVLYADVNVNGTTVLLEAAKKHKVGKFIFSSSSSVYGNPRLRGDKLAPAEAGVPFSENDNVDFPISPYAATKKAGELICHTYHHLYGIDVTCLRYFTVYGPRQRPDLAIHKFAKLIEQGKPIPVYGDGTAMRDFTYIGDIIDGTVAAMFSRHILRPGSGRACGAGRRGTRDEGQGTRDEGRGTRDEGRGTSEKSRVTSHGFTIYNLGHSHPISVNDLIAEIEKVLGKKAVKEYLPPQPGDVERTYADITKAAKELGYNPSTTIQTGLAKFTTWLRNTT